MSRGSEPILIDGSDDATTRILLAHSAGAPMDSPFMNSVASQLGARTHVIRFEFPYMAARRAGSRRPPDREAVLLSTWREMIAAHRAGARTLIIGGKSMGGRIATMVADEMGVDGVICFGYPFHPREKSPGRRLDHLRQLRTPLLIVQGTRDEMGNEEEVAGYGLPAAIELAWIEGAGHSLTRRRSAHGSDDYTDAAIARALTFLDRFTTANRRS